MERRCLRLCHLHLCTNREAHRSPRLIPPAQKLRSPNLGLWVSLFLKDLLMTISKNNPTEAPNWQHAEYYKEWRQLVGDQLLGGDSQLGYPDPLWVDPYKQILPNQTKQRKN